MNSMKTRLVFQKFKKQHIHSNLYWHYAVDYVNRYCISIKSPSFGKIFPIQIDVDCLENGENPNLVEITKAEFMAEYKKAIKLLRDVNIVTR